MMVIAQLLRFSKMQVIPLPKMYNTFFAPGGSKGVVIYIYIYIF